MSELFGSEALPGYLPHVLEPWARALADAKPQNSDWVREATEDNAAALTKWVQITSEIETARRAASSASMHLADLLDLRDETGAQLAKVAAQEAFRRLVAALAGARPDEGKAALGLGW